MSDHDLTVRIDVLDFLLMILEEHEKTLSENIKRLEDAIEKVKVERRKRACFPIG